MLRSTAVLAVFTLALAACDGTTTRRDADAADSRMGNDARVGGDDRMGADGRMGGDANTNASMASVRTIELGKSAGPSLRVTSTTTTFAPTDTMYLAVIVANPDTDSRLTARWSAEDGSVIDSSGQSVARDTGTSSSVTQFRVMHDSAWPVGKYTVDVWMNGVLAGTKMFTVAR